MTSCSSFRDLPGDATAPLAGSAERKLTTGPAGAFSPTPAFGRLTANGSWYDTRSDSEGAVFDGQTIAMVNVATGRVDELYRARNGAHCGVVTFHPREWKVAFILGPEHPTDDWQYCPCTGRVWSWRSTGPG